MTRREAIPANLSQGAEGTEPQLSEISAGDFEREFFHLVVLLLLFSGEDVSISDRGRFSRGIS